VPQVPLKAVPEVPLKAVPLTSLSLRSLGCQRHPLRREPLRSSI
jgi:hypothetical protein